MKQNMDFYRPPAVTREMFQTPSQKWLKAVDRKEVISKIPITPELRRAIKHPIANLIYTNGICKCGSRAWWNDNGVVKCLSCQTIDKDYFKENQEKV